ncbi:MAG: DUF4956 domain-containing protein [Propionibacteriaceae bacterium]|nr:DUF4956 domain-containing protein [Propionibacteriaceae bacterium]
MIKDSVLREFSDTVSPTAMIISLLVAFIIGLFVIFIYRRTFNGVVFSRQFCLSLLLLAMVTAVVIQTIKSDLALSLGMVGALSIVRFRTAVKEPVDTAFMFWAVAAGIMSGTGLYLVALLSSAVLGALFLIGFSLGFRSSSAYLVVVKYETAAEDAVGAALKQAGVSRLKSKTVTRTLVEATYEYESTSGVDGVLAELRKNDEFASVSALAYRSDFGA